jgi:hypothetical protein
MLYRDSMAFFLLPGGSLLTKRRFRLGLALMVLTVSLQAQTPKKPAPKAPADGDQSPFRAFQSFSATLNGGMGNDHDRKIYRSGKIMRMDVEDHYNLVDLEKLTTRVVEPHHCQQFPRPDVASYPFSAYYDFKVVRAPTEEKETVDGHSCKVENVTFTRGEDDPIVIQMKLWEAEDLQGFPVKVEVSVVSNGNKFTLKYTNVSLQPPDPALFESPAKCKVVSDKDYKPMGAAKTPPSKSAPKAAPKPQ